jgi:RnfABCDGE-type electron transport complex B subunit
MSIVVVTLLLAAGTLLLLAILMSTILGTANKAFHVPVDVRIEKVNAVLPAANCGGCDYVGCNEYAEAVVNDGEACDKCPVGGDGVAQKVAGIMGVELSESHPVRPIVHCAAKTADRLQQRDYQGEQTCNSANVVAGVQGCVYGCLGKGDCVDACDYDAIHVIDGVAVVDYVECIGCGACAKVCPRNIITMTPFKADRILAVLCASKDFGKEVQAVCNVGCTGCKSCMKVSEGLITVKDNLPTIDYQKYDPGFSLQVIQDKCRRESMVWIGKPTPKDLAATADKELPARLEADFKTSVDQTEWRG